MQTSTIWQRLHSMLVLLILQIFLLPFIAGAFDNNQFKEIATVDSSCDQYNIDQTLLEARSILQNAVTVLQKMLGSTDVPGDASLVNANTAAHLIFGTLELTASGAQYDSIDKGSLNLLLS